MSDIYTSIDGNATVDLQKYSKRYEDEITRLRAEVESLHKCCTQRGARMQIMREFIKRNVITDSFGRDKLINECPEAAGWFDADGVPVEVLEDE